MLKLLFWATLIYIGYSFYSRRAELKGPKENPPLPEDEFVDYEEIEE